MGSSVEVNLADDDAAPDDPRRTDRFVFEEELGELRKLPGASFIFDEDSVAAHPILRMAPERITPGFEVVARDLDLAARRESEPGAAVPGIGEQEGLRVIQKASTF